VDAGFGVGLLVVISVAGAALGYILGSEDNTGAVGRPGSACKAAPSSVDCILERLPWANIAFNTPEKMKLDSSYTLALRLSPAALIDTLAFKELVGDSAAVVGTARVRFAKRMSANLRGGGFRIDPPPSELQLFAVSETTPTDWTWRVTPERTGALLLTLALDAHLIVDGREAPYPYRVFSRTIKVHATLSQQGGKLLRLVKDYWELLAAAAALLIAGIRLRSVKRRRRIGFRSLPP
jgi:hypothetical protein